MTLKLLKVNDAETPCFETKSSRHSCGSCGDSYGGHGGVECWHISETTTHNAPPRKLKQTYHVHLCQVCIYFGRVSEELGRLD